MPERSKRQTAGSLVKIHVGQRTLAGASTTLPEMQALRHEILPPSGVEFASCLKLLPATISEPSGSRTTGHALFNVVVARTNFLRVFEVREEPAPISTQKDDERERRASVRRGTEAVEGEVEMDASGEGFVNMGSAKVNLDTQRMLSYSAIR